MSPSLNHYSVQPQLVCELIWEQARKTQTRLKTIAKPFSEFLVVSNQPIPVETDVVFDVTVSGVTLLHGQGRVVSVRAEQHEHLLEIEVEHVDPQSHRSITERLAPFVQPDSRAIYSAVEEEAATIDDEKWIVPWVDSGYRLTLLLDLIAQINSTMDEESLLAAIMQAAQVIMEADASSLMLLDRETRELIITVPTGPARAEISGIRIPPGQGFGGWVATHGDPLAVADAQRDPRFFGDVAKSGFQTRSLICVPLRSEEGEVIGVLQAVNKSDGSHFTDMDIPVFTVLADQAAIAIEKARLHEEFVQKELLEQQLNLAHEIQEGFWPKSLPEVEGVDFAAMNIPATHIGGDYYDFIPMGEGHWGLVVGDISGKGVPAALLMATLRAALRAQIENNHTVEETISLVNNTLVKDTPDEKFVTLFYGVVDGAERTFTFVNAGHNPPLLYDPQTDEMQYLEAGGTLVGFLEDMPFISSSEQLKPGQVLVVYTDGVTEAQTEEEAMFGEDRLEEIVRKYATDDAQTLMDRIYEAMTEFVQGARQFDDITMVIMKVESD